MYIFLNCCIYFLPTVFTAVTSTVKYNEYVADIGQNITIPCSEEKSTIWLKEGNNQSVQFHVSRANRKYIFG